MHYKLLFPSEYVGAHDLNGRDYTVTMASVTVQELMMQGGVKDKKPVVTFSDAKKKLILNKTNARTVAALYGNDTEAWKGQKITLYPTTTKCGRETVECIRIRDRAPSGNSQPQQQTRQRPALADGQRIVTMPIRIATEGEGLHEQTYLDGPDGRFRVEDVDLLDKARLVGEGVEVDLRVDGELVVGLDAPD